MTVRSIFPASAILLAIMAMPATAFAQFSGAGGLPTKIAADDVQYKGDHTVLNGGVDVRQGDVRILADKMTVFSGQSGGITQGNLDRIEAEGNFYYIDKDQSVRGRRGTYTQVDEKIVVTGDVILKQEGGNVITGERLYYDTQTQNARVVGTCKGRKCGSVGRVNILIKNSPATGRPNS